MELHEQRGSRSDQPAGQEKALLTAFVDAEYTDLPGRGKPVSIGIVIDDACFYAEFPRRASGSQFYQDTVVPLLDSQHVPASVISARLIKFIDSLAPAGSPLMVVHDIQEDFDLLRELLAGSELESRLRSVLYVPDDDAAFDSWFCPIRRPRHQALNDARALAHYYSRPEVAAAALADEDVVPA